MKIGTAISFVHIYLIWKWSTCRLEGFFSLCETQQPHIVVRGEEQNTKAQENRNTNALSTPTTATIRTKPNSHTNTSTKRPTNRQSNRSESRHNRIANNCNVECGKQKPKQSYSVHEKKHMPSTDPANAIFQIEMERKKNLKWNKNKAKRNKTDTLTLI